MTDEPNILIVEDDRINAFVLERFIQPEYAFVLAENGNIALEQLETGSFDLIVMDINLGDDSPDGIEVLKRLRQMPRYREVPVIATTAYALQGDRERFLREGFTDYLPKPLRREDLLEKIHRLLKTA